MSSPLQCAFNVMIHLQQHHGGKEDQIWFANSGGIGWVNAIGFSTQLIGVNDSVNRVVRYFADISPVPANNDAENQPAADAFLAPLLAEFSEKVISELFRKACSEGSAEFYQEINGIGVSVVVKYQYPIFYSSRKYKATLDIDNLVAIQTTELLELSEIFSAFETAGVNLNAFAYFLDKRDAPVDAFVQYQIVSSEAPNKHFTLAAE